MDKNLLIKKIFGDKAFIVSPLSGGMMNESYIVENEGKRYVLYISTAQANEMVDRPLEKANQALAIKLGITSKNIYFDTDKGIKVNEFIAGSSLDKVDSYDPQKVADLLKKLHSSKELSREDYAPFKRFPAYENEALSFVKKHSDEYMVIRNTLYSYKDFLESQEKVLCHNDSQKSNIVKGDDGKYYIIDFEFVGNNDPIYDIAAFGNGVVQEGYEVLEKTYGQPSIEEKKRFYLWRIFLSLQWYNVAIVKHYRGEGAMHGFDFMQVAKHFFDNASVAYQELLKLK